MFAKCLISIFLLTGISSCYFLGYNFHRSSRSEPRNYPTFTASDSLLGSNGSLRNNFDVTYYDLNVEIQPDKRFISGYVDVTIRCVTDLSNIQLDLAENMKLEKVLYQNTDLHFERKFNSFFVHFNQPLLANDTLTLRVQYSGQPSIARKPPWEGGFVWEKKDNAIWAGVACERIGANIWWPLKDYLGDEPDSMAINITVPKDLYAVSNGRLSGIQKTNETQNTFNWRVDYPINSYNITFYLGNYTNFQLKERAGRSLNFYVLKPDLEKAEEHFKQTVDIYEFYESKFGPYAFPLDEYKLVESPYAGMEHQSAIAYGSKFRNDVLGFDYIILHETAHEWWGNAVSAQDFSDIWLHEGFATYSEALYIEHKYGYEAYKKYILYYSDLIRNIRPMVGPVGVNYWNYHDSDPYCKGALTLHSLRNTLQNDSLFFNILRTYYERYKFQSVTSRNFIDVVNELSGQQFDWFFNQFLYNHKPPRLYCVLKKNTAENKYELFYQWMDTEKDFQMPVSVWVGNKREQIFPTTEMQHLPCSEEVFFYTDSYYKLDFQTKSK